MNFKISYAITISEDETNLDSLLNSIVSEKREQDEIVVQVNSDIEYKNVDKVLAKYKLKKHSCKFKNLSDFKNNLKKMQGRLHLSARLRRNASNRNCMQFT